MSVVLGAIIVTFCVVGGYLMEHGNLALLFQPAEVVIIFGAAIGGLIISVPPKIVKKIVSNVFGIIGHKGSDKETYINLLVLVYQIFGKMRRDGLLSIEADLENTKESDLFKKYASDIHDEKVIDFICDNLKVLITVAIPPHELEELMDKEIETLHHEALIPSHSVNRMADSLPGLGIVAAVMGVVLTMGKIDQPPKILGESIGAALVGTFTGVLLCYGYVGPLAAYMEHEVNEEMVFFHMIKTAMVSFVGGGSPQMAVEFGRRTIPSEAKPSFNELEKALKAKK